MTYRQDKFNLESITTVRDIDTNKVLFIDTQIGSNHDVAHTSIADLFFDIELALKELDESINYSESEYIILDKGHSRDVLVDGNTYHVLRNPDTKIFHSPNLLRSHLVQFSRKRGKVNLMRNETLGIDESFPDYNVGIRSTIPVYRTIDLYDKLTNIEQFKGQKPRLLERMEGDNHCLILDPDYLRQEAYGGRGFLENF